MGHKVVQYKVGIETISLFRYLLMILVIRDWIHSIFENVRSFLWSAFKDYSPLGDPCIETIHLFGIQLWADFISQVISWMKIFFGISKYHSERLPYLEKVNSEKIEKLFRAVVSPYRSSLLHTLLKCSQTKNTITYRFYHKASGKKPCWMDSVDWQKHGLTHAHILILLIEGIKPE